MVESVVTATSSPFSPATGREGRMLRWVFQRNHERIVFELGLTSDLRDYELRTYGPHQAAGHASERFDDAVAAFQRHGTMERALIDDGWSLEAFESTDCDAALSYTPASRAAPGPSPAPDNDPIQVGSVTAGPPIDRR